VSEEIATAAGDIIDWQRRAATAEALEAYWKQKHADAWILIGRLDYALERIAEAEGIRSARLWARKMRQEIKDNVGKGGTA